MDESDESRDYMRRMQLHDYGYQAKRLVAKIVVPVNNVSPDTVEDATASLCQPKTKGDDPRIWGAGLARRAKAGNFHASLGLDGMLPYVATISTSGVLGALGTPLGTLARVVEAIERGKSGSARELQGKLRDVAARGYVESHRPEPTTVGNTCETQLRIEANSGKSLDFSGIEPETSKTALSGQATKNQVNLLFGSAELELQSGRKRRCAVAGSASRSRLSVKRDLRISLTRDRSSHFAIGRSGDSE